MPIDYTRRGSATVRYLINHYGDVLLRYLNDTAHFKAEHEDVSERGRVGRSRIRFDDRITLLAWFRDSDDPQRRYARVWIETATLSMTLGDVWGVGSGPGVASIAVCNPITEEWLRTCDWRELPMYRPVVSRRHRVLAPPDAWGGSAERAPRRPSRKREPERAIAGLRVTWLPESPIM